MVRVVVGAGNNTDVLSGGLQSLYSASSRCRQPIAGSIIIIQDKKNFHVIVNWGGKNTLITRNYILIYSAMLFNFSYYLSESGKIAYFCRIIV